MTAPSRSQPNTDRTDFTRRMMSNIDGSKDAQIAALVKALEAVKFDQERIGNCAPDTLDLVNAALSHRRAKT